MGCGSSSAVVAVTNPLVDRGVDEDCGDDDDLAAYISSFLNVKKQNATIQGYVDALEGDGYDLPSDFDKLTIDVLEKEYGFKKGHLDKVRYKNTHN